MKAPRVCPSMRSGPRASAHAMTSAVARPRYANAMPAPTSADGSKRAKLKKVTTGRIAQRLTDSMLSAIAVAFERRRAASTPAAEPARMTAATASTVAG